MLRGLPTGESHSFSYITERNSLAILAPEMETVQRRQKALLLCPGMPVWKYGQVTYKYV